MPSRTQNKQGNVPTTVQQDDLFKKYREAAKTFEETQRSLKSLQDVSRSYETQGTRWRRVPSRPIEKM